VGYEKNCDRSIWLFKAINLICVCQKFGDNVSKFGCNIMKKFICKWVRCFVLINQILSSKFRS